ncbi:MAG: hypothetical protein Q9210_004119 [Variospora velana]
MEMCEAFNEPARKTLYLIIRTEENGNVKKKVDYRCANGAVVSKAYGGTLEDTYKHGTSAIF